MSLAAGIIAAVAAAGAAVVGDQNAKKDRHQRARERQINQIQQEKYAREGIQMKVEDARKAGIHPLYALGANTPTYNPVSMDSGPERDYVAEGISNVGQDISRSMAANKTAEEKQTSGMILQAAKLDIDGKEIENQIKLQQLKQLMTNQPSLPGSQNLIPGQGNSPIQNKPMERTRSMHGAPSNEPGATNTVGFGVNADGSLTPVPSKDYKEKIEDNFFHEASHFMRNNILPNFTGGNPPPGYYWDYSSQAYRKGKNPHFKYGK